MHRLQSEILRWRWARNKSGGRLLAVALALSGGAWGQTFDSGSNGSDGALNLTTPGTIRFDPKTFVPPLDPDGDNVYHFTTINIGAGVTVKLSGAVLSGPVYWLASGDISIVGTLDIDGEPGTNPGPHAALRMPSVPGAGGYAGGIGGLAGTSMLPQNGQGPGGGAAETVASPVSDVGGGQLSANQFLVPLVGGSGGGGASRNLCTASGPSSFGSAGGSGGGAILLASSSQVVVSGLISANGGGVSSLCINASGGGSGGSIRIVSDRVELTSGTRVRALGGATGGNPCQPCRGSAGRIRIETNVIAGSGTSTPSYIHSPPYQLLLPSTPPPSISVTDINGNPINANPFTFPDTVINSASPVTVEVKAHFVPIGTIPQLTIVSESGADQEIEFPPLQGSLEESMSTATVMFPTGGSRGFVKVTWQD